jgi:anti-anti-sigma factor
MKIMRRQINSVAILEIEGDVVGSWVRKLQNQIGTLKETGTNKIIMDMKEVNSIDSFGISVILTSIKKDKVKIRFSNVRYQVREMFDRSGIADIYDTKKEALESFGVSCSQMRAVKLKKRKYARKYAVIPAEVWFINQESEKIFCNATITNISGGGVFLEYIDCNSKFKKVNLEELLHTELELAIPDSLELAGLRARVARLDRQIEQIGLGVEFTKVNPGIRERIINFVGGK